MRGAGFERRRAGTGTLSAMTTTNTNDKLMGGGFQHVAVRTQDFEGSGSFYKDLLGCEPTIAWGEAPKRAIMLDTGDGNYIEIFERVDQAPPPRDTEHAILHFAFRTDNVDTVMERVRGAGVEVTMEPTDLEVENTTDVRPALVPVRIAFFKGPSGEVIELFANELT